MNFESSFDVSSWVKNTLLFLVGAFSLTEKSPTITVGSFFHFFFSRRFSSEKSPTITVTSFFPFFRQTTDLIVFVPLFTDFTRSRVLVSSLYSVYGEPSGHGF